MSLADTLSSVSLALAPKEEVKVTYRDGLPDFIDVPSAPEVPQTPEGFNSIIADIGVTIPDGYELQLVEARKNMAAWTRDSEKQELAVTRPNWTYRFKVVRTAFTYQIKEFRDYAQSLKRKPKAPAPAGNRTVGIMYADPQVGKAQHTGGGTVDTEHRVADLFHQAQDYVRLQKAKTLVFGDLGDACESTQNSSSQKHTNDLSFPEQIRVARRLFMYGADMFSRLANELTIFGVPSNHMQWRENGKAQGNASADFGLDIVASVQDAFSLNDSAYGHVEFAYPERHREALVLNVGGLNTGFFHGHQAGNADGLAKFIGGQVAGRQALAQAEMFVSAHFHSYFQKTILANQMLLGCPSADNGSDWFTNITGIWSSPGLLVFTVEDGKLMDVKKLEAIL